MSSIEWTRGDDGTPGETWLQVPGYHGYEVTSTGRIRSKRGEMRPMVWTDGHPYIFAGLTLRAPSSRRKLHIHTAVLTAFGEMRQPGQVCRHLNGNPADNRIENLQWGTPSENARDKVVHGRIATGSYTCSPLTDDDVAFIRRSSQASRIIGAQLGVSHTTIQKIRRGARWCHGSKERAT